MGALTQRRLAITGLVVYGAMLDLRMLSDRQGFRITRFKLTPEEAWAFAEELEESWKGLKVARQIYAEMLDGTATVDGVAIMVNPVFQTTIKSASWTGR